MRIVTVTEARRMWGALLDLVERGEEIIITRWGRRIARLVPDIRAAETNRDG
jgi:prevent-host-death family protein